MSQLTGWRCSSITHLSIAIGTVGPRGSARAGPHSSRARQPTAESAGRPYHRPASGRHKMSALHNGVRRAFDFLVQVEIEPNFEVRPVDAALRDLLWIVLPNCFNNEPIASSK